MKTKLISIVFFASLFTLKMASAQSLTFSYDGQDVSNEEVTVEIPGLFGQVDLPLTNISDEIVSVKMMKEEIRQEQGAFNSFCFGGGCLPPTIMVSPNPETLLSGEVYPFYGQFNGSEVGTTTIVKYTAFNENDTTDNVTVEVTVHFVEPNFIHKNMNDFTFAAYPNPASGSDIFIDYSISGLMEEPGIAIYNMLGIKVFEQPVNNRSGKVQINIGQLSKGIYLYVLENNGKTVVAKKLIVK